MGIRYSILLPTIGNKNLIDSISSVFACEYDNALFEVIVINDNPNFDSTVILDAFPKDNFQNLRIFDNDSNIGITASLNKGLKKAKGEFICRLDDDDLFYKGRFTKLDSILLNNPGVVVITGSAKVIDEKGDFYLLKPPSTPLKVKLALERRNILIHPALNIRRESLLSINGYNEQFKYAQDYELYLRLIEHNISIFPTDEIFVIRHEHGHSITLAKRKQQALFSLSALTLYHARNWKGSPTQVKIISVAFMRFATPQFVRNLTRRIRALKQETTF